MVKRFLLVAIDRILNSIIRMLPRKYELPCTYYKYRTIGMFDEEILMLPKLVAKGGVAVDVGAHMGLYSYVLSKICDTVEAFEPVPNNWHILRAYNAHNINVHDVALSSAEGKVTLNIPTYNNVLIYGHASLSNDFPAQKKIQVSIRKLDDYNFADVKFIKIDVEGHELEVIRGAKGTIAKWRPVMLIEIDQRQLSFPINMVFEEILSCGYKGFFLCQNRLHSLADFSVDNHQKTDFAGKYRNKMKYVNNFLFIPDDKPLPEIVTVLNNNSEQSP